MDPERWQRVRSVFDAAAELEGPAREQCLAEGCVGDAALEAEVRSLLAAEEGDAVSVLERDAPDLLDAYAVDNPDDDGSDWLGQRLGAYLVEDEIGRGGMGAVYRARRVDGNYEGAVAIKRIRGGLGAAEMRARFNSERRMLASLDHPNIARLLDAGASREGEPYLVLEYVDGESISDYADRRALDVRQRAQLFLDVCDAVAHAHDRLIVHRDLKPSNVLVTSDGRVKLLDFGVAKLLADDGDASQRTRTMMRIFTPEYAAPEQIRGDVMTTAVDVYALGLLLFDLLTGRRPYRTTSAHPLAVERAVLEDEPQRPSSALSRRDPDAVDKAARRGTSNDRLKRALRGDFDAIVMKALRKDPAERYTSVRRLADDVRAHLAHLPVQARQGDTRYRAGRFVQRHAVALGIAALVVLALAGGLGVALWQAREARAQRDIARAEVDKSRQLVDFLVEMFALADPGEAKGAEVTARELLTRGAVNIRDAFKDQPASRAELLGAIGQAQVGLGMNDEAIVLLDEAVELTQAAGATAAAQAQLRRAGALEALGRYDEVLRDAATARAALPTDTREARLLAAALDERLASAAQAKGDHAAADRYYQSAMAARRAELGENDPDTHQTALRYVSLLTLRGDHAQAKAVAEPIAQRLAQSGNDPLHGKALAALAMAESNLGDQLRAEALRRESLAIYRAAYGDDHPTVAGAENDLATVLFGQKRYTEAAPIFERVLAFRRAALRPEHPGIATVANNLAWCRLLTGDAAGAHALAEEALRIRIAAYGDAHTSTAMSRRALATAEIDLGNLDAAEMHLRAGLAAYDSAVGTENKIALGTINDIARVLILKQTVEPGCATAVRAAKLAGEGDPASKEQLYQQLLLAACAAQAGSATERARALDLATALQRIAADDTSLTRRTAGIVAAL